MPSHRIAAVPLSSSTGQPLSSTSAAHPRAGVNKTNIAAISAGQVQSPRSNLHRSSSCSRSSPRIDVNTTRTATDTQIIRITCGQIFQALHGASELLNGDVLQHICAEILVFSEDVIKSKCNDTNNVASSSSLNQSLSRSMERQRVAGNEPCKEEDGQSLAGSIERCGESSCSTSSSRRSFINFVSYKNGIRFDCKITQR